MSRIDRLGELVNVLRTGRTASSLAKGAQQRPQAKEGGGGAEHTLEALRATVSARVRAVEGDEAERRRGRARAFVESVLVWELGEDVLGDPEFDAVVGRVEEDLLADDALAERLASLLDELARA